MNENDVPELPLLIETFLRLTATERAALITIAGRMLRCHYLPPEQILARTDNKTGQYVAQ